MRIGKEKHESVLTDTIKKLEDDGYRVIRLDGKSPTMVAFNQNETVAVSVFGRKKLFKGNRWSRTKTITFLEDEYKMFNRIERVHFDINKDIHDDVVKNTYNEYKKKKYNVIVLNGKSPDAIAYNGKGVFAVEIIGVQQGCNPDRYIQNKEDMYTMFDGLMVKTFIYENDDVFTETFGKQRGV